MSAILASLTDVLSPRVVDEIGTATGLERDLVSRGMGVVVPIVVTTLAHRSTAADDLDTLMHVLPRDGLASARRTITSLPHGDRAAGTVRAWIFGSGAAAVAGTVDRSLGFNAGPLLDLAGPLVLGLIAQLAYERSLDADGVREVLVRDSAEFQRTGGESVRLVREALEAGAQAAVTTHTALS